MEPYFTTAQGISGRIKKRIADFKVSEIGVDGKKCEIKAFTDTEKIELEKDWPENRGEEHLHLTLEKYNTDQNNAIRMITRHLRTSRKRVGYAGMKDKRAITSQRISIWKPDYERVKEFRSRYVDLRGAVWSDKRIELGDLEGNAFEITIREISLEQGGLEKCILDFFKQAENGVPNYFGEQRFGGIRQVTHLVGKEFIKGSPERAVMLYLCNTNEREEEEVRVARQNLAATGDFAKATKEFPMKYRYERSIIHHLCKYPKDYVGAFQKLPAKLQYMFTHALQSYFFNRIIARRIEIGYGLGEIGGDILEDGIPTAPLFGFESRIADGKAGEMEKQLLEEEGFSLQDFKVKQYPQLSSKGARKRIVLHPKEMRLIEIGGDEHTEGMRKAVISFNLEKGAYATTVLRELMKNEMQ